MKKLLNENLIKPPDDSDVAEIKKFRIWFNKNIPRAEQLRLFKPIARKYNLKNKDGSLDTRLFSDSKYGYGRSYHFQAAWDKYAVQYMGGSLSSQGIQRASTVEKESYIVDGEPVKRDGTPITEREGLLFRKWARFHYPQVKKHPYYLSKKGVNTSKSFKLAWPDFREKYFSWKLKPDFKSRDKTAYKGIGKSETYGLFKDFEDKYPGFYIHYSKTLPESFLHGISKVADRLLAGEIVRLDKGSARFGIDGKVISGCAGFVNQLVYRHADAWTIWTRGGFRKSGQSGGNGYGRPLTSNERMMYEEMFNAFASNPKKYLNTNKDKYLEVIRQGSSDSTVSPADIINHLELGDIVGMYHGPSKFHKKAWFSNATGHFMLGKKYFKPGKLFNYSPTGRNAWFVDQNGEPWSPQKHGKKEYKYKLSNSRTNAIISNTHVGIYGAVIGYKGRRRKIIIHNIGGQIYLTPTKALGLSPTDDHIVFICPSRLSNPNQVEKVSIENFMSVYVNQFDDDGLLNYDVGKE